MMGRIDESSSSIVMTYNGENLKEAVDNNQPFDNEEINRHEEIDQVQLDSAYLIQAALFSIPSSLGRFGLIGHDFWLLVKKERKALVAALHGLATADGRPIPIGYSKNHSLQVYHCVYDENFAKQNNFSRYETFSLQAREVKTMEIDSKENVLQRWRQAVDKIPELNKKNLGYPFLGLGFSGKPVNSNSAYRTFANIMGFEPHKFPNYWQPGWQQSMISEPTHSASNSQGDSDRENLLVDVNVNLNE